MDRKIAEQIVTLVNGCIDSLISSLAPVEAEVSPEEYAAYKRGVARVINTFDLEIVDRIAREHPDLKPDDDEVAPPDEETPPPRGSRN
jgi:hypothetical protein